jgi:phage I-like protein
MTFRSSPISIKLDETAGSIVPADVQVIRTGTYYSDQYGKFEITKEILLSMKSNFDQKVRGIDLAIDYKHDSEDVAAGWIESVYLLDEGNELWAKVKWTPNGQKVLSDKEFRYISADFEFNFQHNETKQKHGPTLFGAGLTNRPFIKNMKPVVELTEGIKMDPKDQKIAELEAQIAELKKQVEAKKDIAPEPSDEMKAKMEAMEKELTEYKEKDKKNEEAKVLAEKTSSFNKLLSEGKAVEAQRESFMAGDTVKFAEKAQAVNLSSKGSSSQPVGDMSLEDAQKEIIKLAEQEVKDKKLKTLGDGIKLVLQNNPELRAKYEGK